MAWLQTGQRPDRRGDFILFAFAGEPRNEYPGLDRQPFFKIVRGLPGDVVTVSGRTVSVNGVAVGTAKLYTFDRRPLAPIAPTVIPPMHYYVQGTAPDSLDSRYRSCGLVLAEQVLGRVISRFERRAMRASQSSSAVICPFRSLCTALLGLSLAGPALPRDLGTIGPTYGISEPHLLDFIRQRLRDKERSGELGRLMDEARSRGVDAVRSPAPVVGLRSTESARTWYVDPSFTLDRNIVDARGNLLFPAGTRKNPLEVVSLSKRLLFFDARDGRQVARARELVAQYGGRVKPILTGRSYLDLMKAWRVPVYYDQHGALTRRFSIRQVPAIVSQEGMRLRIDEVRVQ